MERSVADSVSDSFEVPSLTSSRQICRQSLSMGLRGRYSIHPYLCLINGLLSSHVTDVVARTRDCVALYAAWQPELRGQCLATQEGTSACSIAGGRARCVIIFCTFAHRYRNSFKANGADFGTCKHLTKEVIFTRVDHQVAQKSELHRVKAKSR
jgi:hypothetical protein